MPTSIGPMGAEISGAQDGTIRPMGAEISGAQDGTTRPMGAEISGAQDWTIRPMGAEISGGSFKYFIIHNILSPQFISIYSPNYGMGHLYHSYVK